MSKKMPIHIVEELYQMHSSGMSYQEIADKTNLSVGAASYHINNYIMERAEQMFLAKQDIMDFKSMRMNKLFSLPDIQVGQVFIYGGEMFLVDEPHSKVEWSPIANKYVPNLMNQ